MQEKPTTDSPQPGPLDMTTPSRRRALLMTHGSNTGIRMAIAVLAVAAMGACGSSNASGGRTTAEASPGTESGNAGATETARTPQTRTSPEPGTAWVIFGADTVVAEVASTPAERSQGLMDREELPEGTGMLFVFPNSEIRSFWMKNTFVPLDIAFLDDSFTVVDIKQLEPENETPVDAEAASTFALEVIQGWFESRGVAVGDRATIIFGPGLRVS